MSVMMLVAFLFLKTGEKFATQETAAPTVGAFLAVAGKGMDGAEFAPQVMNDPAKAVEFVASKKPEFGIVTPGFYLAYGKALEMRPLLEVRRQKVESERFVLVMRKNVGETIDAAKGKVIATTLSAEERYVKGVILQDKLGAEARLKAITDVEAAAMDLAEGAKDAAEAVLMEEGAWKAIEKDEELGTKLRVVFRSDDLPCALLVAFRAACDCPKVAKLQTAYKNIQGTDDGKQALASIRVEKFEDVNAERLKKAEKLFLGQSR
jgi:hypothetical protein